MNNYIFEIEVKTSDGGIHKDEVVLEAINKTESLNIASIIENKPGIISCTYSRLG